MKRWQDRGEVQDSDDEDLSLGGGGESQSPQQARKKPRLDDHHGSRDDIRPPDSFNGVDGGGDEDVDIPWLAPAHGIAYGGKARPTRQPASSTPRREALSVAIPSGPPSTSAQRHYGQSDDLPSSSRSDDLPNPSQLIAGQTKSKPTTPTFVHDDIGSLQSSPLTELGDTPKSSAGLFRHSANAQSANDSASTRIIPSERLPIDNSVPSTELAELPDGRAIIVDNRGRTFRARTEKQLHPYGWDKTLYQQQWKQRGLKPIQVVDQHAAETQDQSYSGDDSDSQQQPFFSSSPVRPSPNPNRTDNRAVLDHDAGDDFPDIDIFLRDESSGAIKTGRKRRKTAHLANSGNTIGTPSVLLGDAGIDDQPLDVWSIPPSPPPTSSDSQSLPKQRAQPAVFRLPHGATPVPLPTPQVSSEIHRNKTAANEDYDLDDVLPAGTSRPSTVSRARVRPLVIDSSTESEDDVTAGAGAADEPEEDERRLSRERKRIKGVLPASWLKIDFNAQRRRRSPTPTRARKPSTSPTAGFGRLKGVAQRVSKSFSTARQPQALTISDDEEEVPSPGRSDNDWTISPRMDAERQWSALLRTDADDARMEGDWVDPMLTGLTRTKDVGIRRRSKHRQPRIADAFLRAERSEPGNHKEGTRARHFRIPIKSTTRGSQNVAKRTGSTRRPRAPRLSILDLSSPTPKSDEQVPQFLRLAQRQAKRQTGHGRHSPSSKIVRLATAEDTADAETTLNAWREGTIVPRDLPGSSAYIDRAATNGTSHSRNAVRLSLRTPLADVVNYQQRRLPLPLQEEARSKSPHRRVHQLPPGSRPQQTQLRTISTRRPGHDESQGDETRPELRPPHVLQGARRNARPSARSGRYRGGQLESLESAYDREHRNAAFERRMTTLTENIARGQHATGQPMDLVGHYLRHEIRPPRLRRQDSGGDSPLLTHPVEAVTSVAQDDSFLRNAEAQAPPRPAQPKVRLHYGQRKRRPQHIDVEARQFRQPSEPLPSPATAQVTVTDVQVIKNGPTLGGLGPFGTRYATDFDVRPLPLGTFFHSSTFIGSGDFAASLKLAQRDFSVATGRIHVHVADKVLVWEAWTEEVAAGLTAISGTINEAMRSVDATTDGANGHGQTDVVSANIDHMLRSLVRYLSKCLAFLDAIDRRSCIQHLHNFVDHMLDSMNAWSTNKSDLLRLQKRVRQYLLVISHQTYQLCDDHIVIPNTREACRKLSGQATLDLARSVFPAGLQELRSFYEDSRISSKREAGVRDDTASVSTLILLRYCLLSDKSAQSSLLSLLSSTSQVIVSASDTVSALDCAWYDLFTILPALEMDDTGVAVAGQRFSLCEHDWAIPKALLSRLLEFHASATMSTTIGINDYLRATLSRCYILIDRWGWWRCESILGVMFDFFARRNFAPLPKDNHFGSPSFLQELDSRPSLDVASSDRSYNIFLKTLATSLHQMQKPGRYSDKKIGGIVWRFIPSHGRTYPKDADVQEADIEALRNHQDLLCTLYYAAPSGQRPRVDLLRNLVDHTHSHREACRLSVRAWSNLIRFQISCGGSDEAVQPFVAWYKDIAQATMAQFRLARTEAENDYAAACADGNTGVSQTTLEHVIANNQRRIVATLVDAFAGLKRALQTAKTISTVVYLLRETTFWDVLTPFDTSEKRLLPALEEAIEVMKITLEAQQHLMVSNESQSASEESQDFGDSSALDELIRNEHACTAYGVHSAIFDILHEPVRQLLSTVFGADTALDEHILSKVIDIWVWLAGVAVKNWQSIWTNFIDEYHADSWQNLRSTEHQRKFTSYFFARVVEHSAVGAPEIVDTALGVLLVSLVEREATLKFQHLLLSALINHAPNHPILDNLPFTRNARSHRFEVSLLELRPRRLALLSCMLSNMRQHFEHTLHEQSSQIKQVRKQYATFLRQLMQAMKTNFMDLQGGSDRAAADPNAQGAYVDFVQHIVSYLQQYTTDIIRIDDFFTDSSAFPLPATDPMYVVGRLRSYAPKLGDAKARKELTVFVQTVVERAIVDGHQSYLIDQLCTAMNTGLERGSEVMPSLRLVLLTAILPPYLDTALDTACSWMLSSPILTVYGTVAGSLMYNLDTQDDNSVEAVEWISFTMLRSAQVLLHQALSHPGLMRLPHVQRVLALVFDNIIQVQTLCNYLCRRNIADGCLVRAMEELHKGALEVQALLTGADGEWFGFKSTIDDKSRSWWTDTSAFASRQLRESLSNCWHARDGQYFVQRGKAMKEVVVGLGDENDEKEALICAVRDFYRGFEVIHGTRSSRGRRNIERNVGTAALVV